LSHNFELEDAPGYLARFPELRGKAQLGRGEYSVVFEGHCPNTVFKLTVDETTVNFLLGGRLKGCDGIVEFIEYHGFMESSEHPQGVHLVELRRLQEIEVDTHRNLFCERASVIAAIRHRIMESDRFEGIIPAQERHAGALQELAASNLFSRSISRALEWIANFMKSSPLDLLHDLCNPANYMTDGVRLIITDPLVTVPAD
jgi:hypothetical protein